MIWVTFLIAVVFVGALLFVPGYWQGRAWGCDAPTAVACAPFIAFFELAMLGMAFGLAAIEVDWFVLVAVFTSFSVICFLVGKRFVRSSSAHDDPAIDIKCLLVYVLIGSAITLMVLIIPEGDPDRFVQLFDNAFHVNLIHAFVETGRFSSLQASLFPTVPLAPVSDLEFYPAAWHVVCAVTAQALDVSVPLAINATNAVVVGAVFPSAMCVLVGTIFTERPRIRWAAALCMLAFAAFPWGFLVFGPLYSNLASYAVVPAVMHCLVRALRARTRAVAVRYVVLGIVGCASIAVLQPNGVFLLIVVLAPLCVKKVHAVAMARTRSARSAIAWSIGASLAIALVWIALVFGPLLSSVVQYNWDDWGPTAGIRDLAVSVFDLGFRNGLPQYPLAILVLCGIVFMLFKRCYRWLLIPYGFFALGFVLTGRGVDAPIASILTGFWYNDIDRIAACLAIVCIPIASLGLYAIIRSVERLLKGASRKTRRASVIVAYCFAALLLYMPSVSFGNGFTIETGIGARIARVEALASEELALTEEERSFVERCKDIVGEEAVFNLPFDGSAFAYMTADLNVSNRTFFPDYTQDHELLREGLDEIGTEEAVKMAAEHLGVRYIVVLDSNGTDHPTISDEFMKEERWKGILGIDDGTAGLDIVLSEDDMRLYRIQD